MASLKEQEGFRSPSVLRWVVCRHLQAPKLCFDSLFECPLGTHIFRASCSHVPPVRTLSPGVLCGFIGSSGDVAHPASVGSPIHSRYAFVPRIYRDHFRTPRTSAHDANVSRQRTRGVGAPRIRPTRIGGFRGRAVHGPHDRLGEAWFGYDRNAQRRVVSEDLSFLGLGIFGLLAVTVLSFRPPPVVSVSGTCSEKSSRLRPPWPPRWWSPTPMQRTTPEEGMQPVDSIVPGVPRRNGSRSVPLSLIQSRENLGRGSPCGGRRGRTFHDSSKSLLGSVDWLRASPWHSGA